MPPEKNNGLLSLELGVRMVPDGSALHLYHHKTGKKILSPDDAYSRIAHLEKKLAQSKAPGKPRRKKPS